MNAKEATKHELRTEVHLLGIQSFNSGLVVILTRMEEFNCEESSHPHAP